MSSTPSHPPPSSILILGTGVFGLSTLHALLKRSHFAKTHLIVVSPEVSGIPPSSEAVTASIDTTRIIRADYANPMYHAMGEEAQRCWQEQEWGENGRYSKSGLLLTADNTFEDGNMHGTEYMAKSLQNVLETGTANVQELRNKQEIRDAMRAPEAACGTGDSGYINKSSGWADAGSSMAWLHSQVVSLAESRGNVRFIKGEAVRLLHEPHSNQVRGAELVSGEEVTADVTILATGAWTPTLLDLRGVASCRAQVMAYFSLSKAEAEALQHMPVHLNIGSGCFFFPPTIRPERTQNGSISDEQWEIKVARHTYGYANPIEIPAPAGTPADESLITVSLPTFPAAGIPAEDKARLGDFLHSAIPLLRSENGKREPAWSRLCHYLDTPNGDFLVCFHRNFQKSLFLATGGSGHAFKFLPVIGDKIADVFEELWSSGSSHDRHTSRSALATAWDWPKARQIEDEVWCNDGSRSGKRESLLR